MDARHLDVIIVGAGLSGIGAAVHLKARHPGKSFAILEARERLGGTWDLFRYPGIRSDSDMFTLGYAFKPWTNPRAIADGYALLQELNATAYKRVPGIVTIAEESTAWPGVTGATSGGGLGFGFKWNMGWMHDSLRYLAHDPIHRSYHHGEMAFSLAYAFSENYVLPLSHDEVVHGKGSLVRKMPGDRWQQLATLRAYLAYTWAHPGKQLVMMGTELAQHLTELALEAAGSAGTAFQPHAARPGAEVPGYEAPADGHVSGVDWQAIAPLRYFNERAGSIYAGSNEIQRNILAKHVLGL